MFYSSEDDESALSSDEERNSQLDIVGSYGKL